MKFLLLTVLLLLSPNIFGQGGITFQVEKLSKPEKLLTVKSYDDICKNLILEDAKLYEWEVERGKINFDYNILAKSDAPDSLVNYGYHSFFNGMYRAYAEHRPFVLSPDMIWLLISQGFAEHINANPEKLRKHFVNFAGKKTLTVVSKEDLLKNSNPTKWAVIFSQFTSQIAEHTGQEFIDIMTADFSTTTVTEKVASEITVMKAVEPYFEFLVIRVICGIPEITLQGTTEDWQKILDKTKKLGKYDLRWWTKELKPILKEFVKASEGKINKKFWRNMFKYHSKRKYGAPKIIDGWIVKFFPYDKYGKRNSLNRLKGGESLPEEMVKVDLKYVELTDNNTREIMLELRSGFIGLEQNSITFSLAPKIGWMVRKKDVNQTELYQKIESENIPGGGFSGSSIDLNVTEVPDILRKFDTIYSLNLRFKDKVFFPDWIKTKKIGRLSVEGKISKAEKQKILEWFPDTEISIKDKKYNTGKNGWIVVNGSKIPESIFNLDKIWILDIFNYERDIELIIPEKLGEIKIDILCLENKISEDNIEKLKRLLPNTDIYIAGEKIR